MDIDELRTEAQGIQSYLEVTMSNEPAEVVQRGIDLMVYLARTGQMLADAKMLLNSKKKSEAMQLVYSTLADMKLSAKVQNAFVEGLCTEEQYMVDWIDRLNSACTHQMDICRSLISINKVEMQLTATTSKEFS